MAQASSAEVVKKVCSRCHALEVMGHCLAGDCRGRRVVRLSKPAPWNFVLDWMRAMGADISEQDARAVETYLRSRFPPGEYPLAWTKVPSPINTGGWNVVSLEDDGKAIYAGFEGNGKIYRSADGIHWKEVAATGHNTVYGIAPFRGRLYAGTNDPTAQVYTSADGIDWEPDARFEAADRGIISMGTFDGFLYAGTGTTALYRTEDGIEWRPAAVLKPGVPSAFANWIRFLIEFQGHFYAGVEKGPLFWSSNGIQWAPAGGGPAINSGVRGAVVFNGSLYVGTTGGGQIWRTQNGEKWEAVFKAPPHIRRGYVASMAVAPGVLFAAIDGYVFRTKNGSLWEEVGHLSPYTIESMKFFDGTLYAGTLLPPAGQIYRARLDTIK